MQVSKQVNPFDDSGLSVPALAGAPGIISARYARDGATDQENVNCLLKNMVHLPEDKRVACFHSVIVYLPHATHPLPDVFHGVWQKNTHGATRHGWFWL